MATPPPPAASPSLPAAAARKKRRRAPPAAARGRRSFGGSEDDDDSVIDGLLEALGIPDSDKKRRAAEVIELLTPPRTPSSNASRVAALRRVGEVLELIDDSPSAEAAVEANHRRRSLVDLTSPDQSSGKSTSPAASVLAAAASSSSLPREVHLYARSAVVAESAIPSARVAPTPAATPVAEAPSSRPATRELLPLRAPGTPTSDQECDAMLDDLLLMRPLAERIAAARQQSSESLDTSSSTSSSSNSSNSNSSATTSHTSNTTRSGGAGTSVITTSASLPHESASQQGTSSGTEPGAREHLAPDTPQRRKRTAASRAEAGAAAGSQRRGPVVVACVAMERALDASDAGRAIKTALQTHVHNSKPLPVEIEAPFESTLANVIRWERREHIASATGAPRRPRPGANSSTNTFSAATASAAPAAVCGLLSAAIYFQADAFVQLLLLKAYSEVLRLVRALKSDLDARADRIRSQQSRASEIQMSTFLIVEGMDKCLIRLKKKQKSASSQQSSADADSSQASSAVSPPPPHLSFNDIHEMAFQLFMDAETHTQFTVDLEDTAAYVALVTREIVLAAAKKSAQEDFLEGVPRLHSFRVTASGATTNSFANAWLRMLQMIPGVSEDKAQSVVDHFPTVASLLLAYNDPSLNREAKEDLLATRLVGRGLGRALSKRIFNVFCVDNPDALI